MRFLPSFTLLCTLSACAPSTSSSDATTDASLAMEATASDSTTTPDQGTTTDTAPPAEDAVSPLETSISDVVVDQPAPPTDVAMSTGVPLFVGMGHAGRTFVSCDDGRSWIADRSDDNNLRCFSSASADCDHHPGAGTGIAYGNGWFIATFGWGMPGSIRRSRDGAQWERVMQGATYAGISYGDGRFLAAARMSRVSNDDGMRWTDAATAMLSANSNTIWNVRGSIHGGMGRGVFVLYGQDGSNRDWAVSDDGGMRWQRPRTIPTECEGERRTGGFAAANGILLALSASGVACRSTDNGQTWTSSRVGGMVSSHIVWTGNSFAVWGLDAMNRRVRFQSMDGAQWTAQATQTRRADGTMSSGPEIGAVARSSSGTFVAVNGGWQQWYDRQQFYRSADGVLWEALPAANFTGSHPVSQIVFGMGTRPAACR